MSITPYLDDLDVDPEAKRVLGVALEKTRVSLGLADDFANGLIANRRTCQGRRAQSRSVMRGRNREIARAFVRGLTGGSSKRPDPPGVGARRAGTCHNAPSPDGRRDQLSNGGDPVWVAITVAQLYLCPHVAAYPAGRVHRAVPSDKNDNTAVRRPMAARDQVTGGQLSSGYVRTRNQGSHRANADTITKAQYQPRSASSLIGSSFFHEGLYTHS
jgi:hypothetical protein